MQPTNTFSKKDEEQIFFILVAIELIKLINKKKKLLSENI